MAAQYVIGVDGGTEGIRAGVFSMKGEPLAFAATPYATHYPQQGWAEQEPREWWRALGESVRAALAQSGVAARDIVGLCADTTCCSVVALDRDGEALRPALIWMDLRSTAQAEAIAKCNDAALAVNGDGGPVSAEWLLPKALWLKTLEPDIYAKATTICEYQDYLNLHLTGRTVASINNASVRWHYRSRTGHASELMHECGLSDLLEKLPEEVVPLATPLGTLTSAAAEHLGLTTDVLVSQGGADAFIAMIGLGVVTPGRLAFITGSSHLHLGQCEKPFHGPGIWGTYADAVMPGQHTVEGGQTSTGSVVRWLRELFGDDTSYDELNAAASKLPPGADGVVVLDHFQGNRTPYTDPASRGIVSGLNLKHGRAHLFRATLEGIAYGTELILSTMRNNGFTPDEAVICGGATRSDLWLQIHADVSNLPLTVTRVPDAPSLGSAILAAVGASLYDDIGTACREMVSATRVIEPNGAAHAAYAPFYAAYKDTYHAMAEVLHRQVHHASS